MLHLASLQAIQERTIAETLVQGLRDAQPADVDYQTSNPSYPDLIHIVGLGDLATQQLMSRAERLRIPYVVTPLSSLQPWTHTRRPHFPAATILVASSQLEHEQLAKLYPQNTVHLVGNPVVSAAVTFDDYARRMQEVYAEALASHDAAVRDDIAQRVGKLGEEDTAICDILRQALYVGYEHRRHHIRQTTLDRLAATMTAANYDEALMADRLEELQLTSSFAQLETFLADHSTLTEGFMPIEAHPNKTFTLP
ncbi:MAG: hypothetical protein IJJ98_10220 [Prevotella sp.]|nr:hypothetical protein [Prevotella sp.]